MLLVSLEFRRFTSVKGQLFQTDPIPSELRDLSPGRGTVFRLTYAVRLFLSGIPYLLRIGRTRTTDPASCQRTCTLNQMGRPNGRVTRRHLGHEETIPAILPAMTIGFQTLSRSEQICNPTSESSKKFRTFQVAVHDYVRRAERLRKNRQSRVSRRILRKR